MEPEFTRLTEEAAAPPTVHAGPAGDTQRKSERLTAADTNPRPRDLVAAPPTEPDFPRLDGYEILHLLGRGGMGAVYKARQLHLDRVVALKVIRADLGAGEEERARFRTEAEAVARLQHPNIVQVYEVGPSGGVPYIALEFVGGGSLAEHLHGTPLPPRQAAELLETLARAVHHAHERGVVHRDLKPSNILLVVARGPLSVAPDAETPWAEEHPRPKDFGHPKITDFGLAKCLDAEAARHTRTGQILGTPSYMAPEQASGTTSRLGPPCDIYALGAILYELLTGRPPFVGPTPMDAALQVLTEEPVPPRQLQRTVPRDLETACLQCLQKEPHRRYASAHELAEDCASFLRGEPIKARPASVWERGLKWARRRPAVAGLIGVSGLAVLTLLLVAWWYNGLLRAERDEADRQRREALAARRLAERNEHEAKQQRAAALAQEKQAAGQRDKARAWFQQARAAVDAMLTRVGEQLPPVTPEAAQVRRKLLEDALGFYQGFLKEGGSDPAIRRETARAYWRVGSIYETLGEPARSVEAFRRGAELQEKLAHDFPDWPGYAHDLGELYRDLGRVLGALGQEQAAEKAHRDGIKVLEELVSRFPQEPAYRRSLAGGWCGLGSLLLQLGRSADAESAARESLQLLGRLCKENLDDLCQQLLGVSRSNLSTVLARAGRYPEAEAQARQSVELLRPLAERQPTLHHRQNLGHALGNWSQALRSLNRAGEAEAATREALALRRRLAAQFPQLASCRAELSQSLSSLGVLVTRSRPAEAEKLLREAVALREKLAGEFPSVAEYRSELGGALHNLAMALKARPAEARDLIRQAITHQRAALAVNPRHDVYRKFLRNHYWLLSDKHLALRDHAEAAAAAHQLAEVFPKSPLDPFRAGVQLAHCIPLAEKDARLNDDQRRRLLEDYAVQAVAQLRLAVQNGYRNPAELANIPALAPLRGRADFKALQAGE
jgi:serine/threonine protein kinase